MRIAIHFRLRHFVSQCQEDPKLPLISLRYVLFLPCPLFVSPILIYLQSCCLTCGSNRGDFLQKLPATGSYVFKTEDLRLVLDYCSARGSCPTGKHSVDGATGCIYPYMTPTPKVNRYKNISYSFYSPSAGIHTSTLLSIV